MIEPAAQRMNGDTDFLFHVSLQLLSDALQISVDQFQNGTGVFGFIVAFLSFPVRRNGMLFVPLGQISVPGFFQHETQIV